MIDIWISSHLIDHNISNVRSQPVATAAPKSVANNNANNGSNSFYTYNNTPASNSSKNDGANNYSNNTNNNSCHAAACQPQNNTTLNSQYAREYQLKDEEKERNNLPKYSSTVNEMDKNYGNANVNSDSSQLEKKRLEKVVTEMLQESLTIRYSDLRDNLEKEFTAQNTLDISSTEITSQLNKLTSVSRQLREGIEEVETKNKTLGKRENISRFSCHSTIFVITVSAENK